MSITWLVSKFEMTNKPDILNIPFISITELVLKFFISKDVS